MRAAQGRPGRKPAGEGEGSEIKLLNGMRGSIASAQNNAADARPLYQLEQQLAKGP